MKIVTDSAADLTAEEKGHYYFPGVTTYVLKSAIKSEK